MRSSVSAEPGERQEEQRPNAGRYAESEKESVPSSAGRASRPPAYARFSGRRAATQTSTVPGGVSFWPTAEPHHAVDDRVDEGRDQYEDRRAQNDELRGGAVAG